MKKIIILLIAVTSFTAAFSQQDRYRNSQNDHYQSQDDRYQRDDRGKPGNDYKQQSTNYGYAKNDRRYDDRNRQYQIDCVNQEYDRRIYDYRNNRSMNRDQRNRMIHQAEMERSQRISSFGGGVVVGAVAGLVLGALISH